MNDLKNYKVTEKTTTAKFWYAYRSEEAIKKGMGSSYFLAEDGITRVACTALFLSQEGIDLNYLWSDKVYVGRVIRYLGQHTPVGEGFEPWRMTEVVESHWLDY